MSSSVDEHADHPVHSSGKRNDHFYEAWDKFLAVQPKRALETSTTAAKIEEEKKVVDETPGDGLQIQENVATSWEQAAVECRAKVAAIVKECNVLNQKYTDYSFNLKINQYYCLNSLDGRHPPAMTSTDDAPRWAKRVEDIFEKPQFFIDGAAATDIYQGNGGDCWFLASLMAISAKKDLVDKICVARDEQVGVYGFVFVRDGEFIYEVIDDKLFVHVGDDDNLKVIQDWNRDKKQGIDLEHNSERLKTELQTGGEALYFSHCKSNETWVPLIEKAYAKAHGDYFAIEGGYASEGIEDLTGGVGTVLDPEDIMDKDRFWREQLLEVNQKYLFGGATRSTASKGLIKCHAYAVLQAYEEDGLRLLKLRNPWGKGEWVGDWGDGSKLWTAEMMTKLEMTFGDEGVFWISYHDFLKHFPYINRVRLLNDKEWRCAQQWTTVRVPWTVDYLDTKFQFTLSKQSDVVIVLCQPDYRFFDGLQGRYMHSLHFRLCKDGHKPNVYIVRSMHNSGSDKQSTRSVSAEVENLEAGTYNVICKITTNRFDSLPTEEDCIESIAPLADRKEKLLHVGRRFDYAHSKGNRRAMEERHKLDRINLRKDKLKQARQHDKLEKAQTRRRKQRVKNAMKEQQMAYAIACSQRDRRVRQRDLNRQQALDRCQQESMAARTMNRATEPKKDEATPSTGSSAVISDEFRHVPEFEMADSVAKGKDNHIEELSGGLSRLGLDDKQISAQSASYCVPPFEDNDYESPLEAPEELDSDDFDWDSDLDGPVKESNNESSDDEGSSRQRKKDMFADDPWNALCVLGLRVYSLNSEAKVCVIKSENGS